MSSLLYRVQIAIETIYIYILCFDVNNVAQARTMKQQMMMLCNDNRAADSGFMLIPAADSLQEVLP